MLPDLGNMIGLSIALIAIVEWFKKVTKNTWGYWYMIMSVIFGIAISVGYTFVFLPVVDAKTIFISVFTGMFAGFVASGTYVVASTINKVENTTAITKTTTSDDTMIAVTKTEVTEDKK